MRDIETIVHDRNRNGRGRIVETIEVGKRKITKRGGGTGNDA